MTSCTTCLDTSVDLGTLFGHDCPDDIRNIGHAGGLGQSFDVQRGSGEGIGRSTYQGATEAQLSFARKLGATDEQLARISKSACSKLIDELKAKQDAAPVADTRRANRYAGRCVRCGQQVEAEAGYLAKDSSGRWAADHKGECPVVEAPAPKAPEVELTDGMYQVGEQIYKVQRAVHGSGNLYAKALIDGSFEYAAGAIRKLRPEHKMTLDQAKAYGRLYGVCCNCGRTLTDEESIEAGIGPICAQRF